MNIEKYKIELESAIYEGADGEMFIGGKMVEKVLNDYHKEQLNLSSVSNSLPFDFLQNEMIKAIKELAKESTAPDKETPDWLESDIKRGAKWMYKRLTGNDC